MAYKSNKPKKNKSGNERGLNRKGNKNLEKVGEGFRNKEGVFFTKEDKKLLESKVNSANAKRRRILKDRNEDVRTILGVPQDYTVGEDFASKDFLLVKKTKSLQRFKSKAQFNKYLEYLDKVNSRDYIDKKVEIYKQNYITSIQNTFSSDGDKAIDKIKNMSTKEFAKLVNSELYSGIQYIYSPEEYSIRLEGLNAILGVED
jgi:hypothetical protein